MLASVERRCQVANALGAQLFHPSVEVSEVRTMFATGKTGHLTPEERDAYDGLMPGTFWNAFQQGWNRARTGALNV